jgi:RNA polymerase sigma-70 factor (ECF subfamily)
VLESAPRAVAYAASLLQDRAQAEDVVQDCYCRLLARQEHYDLARDGTPLLFRSITNACINLGRRRRGYSLDAGFDGEAAPEPADVRAVQPLDAVLHHELADAVSAGLAKLPVQQRAALELRVLGYAQQEVADMLGLTVSHAGVLIHRARQALAKQLAPLLEERLS